MAMPRGTERGGFCAAPAGACSAPPCAASLRLQQPSNNWRMRLPEMYCGYRFRRCRRPRTEHPFDPHLLRRCCGAIGLAEPSIGGSGRYGHAFVKPSARSSFAHAAVDDSKSLWRCDLL